MILLKISIVEDESMQDIEVIIHCKKQNATVQEIFARLEIINKKILGFYHGDTYLLNAAEIQYIETINKQTFLYTKECVYETMLRLYELEERLCDVDFFRAGKSLIVNFQKIKALKPDLDGRILITMHNEQKLMVSRQYASNIKKKLGVLK